jgi:hypothetical protein
MKKAIFFTTISAFFVSILFGNSRNIHPDKTYSDSIPKFADSSYAQKQMIYYRDTTVTPHFDTLNASPVFKQIDSINAAKKIKADSVIVKKKISHPAKKKNNRL